MYIKFWLTASIILLSIFCVQPDVNAATGDIGSTTWVATDAIGRSVDEATTSKRPNRTVGIFYFIWQGAHGYDNGRKAPDEGVLQPLPSDTKSPYDISKMLKENPENPQFGPVGAFHYWSEPRFGYYVADDEWVIRKHAQMLSDADIDLIIIDATNACIYMPQVNKICQTYTQMRKEGSKTPQIAFIVNSKPESTVERLFKSFYEVGLYKDLWFVWKGKPLLLSPPEGVTPHIANFFSVRHTWFGSKIGKWFEDGKDKWTWADLYPQEAGWHESPYVAEQISVASATHPMSNIGRSYRNGKQPDAANTNSGAGYFFKEQTDHALQVDPEFVFVTGWNEWVAQRFIDGRSKNMIGKKIEKGDTYFVDQYDAEYSRDLEPMKGEFEDNYYYQLTQFVRDYKGGESVKPATPVSGMAVDGSFSDWSNICTTYKDDAGDTFHRNHHGWGNTLKYVNTTGRNDITKAAIAVSGNDLCFYVETKEPITSYKDKDWMKLFISLDSKATGWEGYQFALNIKRPTNKVMTLSQSVGGWKWSDKTKVAYALNKNRMELSIPLSALGLSADQKFDVDFKWVDNGGDNGDILMWQDNGDAAPNARFRYRYKYTPQVPLSVSELRCLSETEPLGVETVTPRLSWKLASTEQNAKQTAYQIQIADSRSNLTDGKANVWDSAKQMSDKQIGVQPKGAKLESAKQYFWRVKVWNGSSESAWSEPQSFGMGLLDQKEWAAEWITREWGKEHTMPYFRKKFSASNTRPSRAIAYLSGLGCSELHVNGKKVGDQFLDPAQSNYDVFALYTAIDITDYLTDGDNTIGVILGDGWYNQDVVWGGTMRYGNPILRMQVEMQYPDGTSKRVVTDRSWEWRESPTLSSNIYAGEVYDARAEVPTWCTNTDKSEGWHTAIAATETPPRMMSQVMPPMRTQEVLKPVKRFKDKDGNWIFDFGKNVTGFPRISLKQPRDTRVKMRMSEAKYPDHSLDFRSTGIEATKVHQTDEYICKGGERESWQPKFTYHGFRYIELSGFVGTPDMTTIEAVVMHSDVERIGTFACSDDQINRLHELAVRTMRSNMHGLPTDCPIRERCGWTGDAHAEVHIANFNFGMENFWIKYLHDMRSSAVHERSRALYHKLSNREFYFGPKPAGLFYMICPGKRDCGVASPDWGTAIVQLPWYVYKYYGNDQVVEEFYPDMKIWVDYNSTLLDGDGLIPNGLGDWCPPGSNTTIDCPVKFSSSAFHFLDLSIMEQSAALLGKSAEAADFAKRKDAIRTAMINTLYDKTGKTYGSQTANSMALDMGLVPDGDQKAVSDAIAENMNAKYDGFMHTGIFGLPRIGKALSENGNKAQAWKMFTKKGEKSFAAMWERYDATSLWEILPTDSVTYSRTLNSSQSHPMQGGYDAWFYESIAGIRPTTDGAGYKKIVLNPTMTDFLSWARATIETPYGKVSSGWKKTDGQISWNIAIPVNCTAEVYIPKNKNAKIDGKPLDPTKYTLLKETPTEKIYSFGSGDYLIEY